MWLLTDPYILILDEPASGLDAFTASSIIDVLRGLAADGKKLVMLSICQARSDLLKQFDHILLLAREGHPVYAGKGQSMLPHFSSLGYNCPLTTNSAEFVLDLITVDLQNLVRGAVSRVKINLLRRSFLNYRRSSVVLDARIVQVLGSRVTRTYRAGLVSCSNKWVNEIIIRIIECFRPGKSPGNGAAGL